ncbi:MAG: hypothetical protein JJ975_13535 [Bacteroidia bacterium]|nr:hypothetical protein [Bacteroidia bacterium]
MRNALILTCLILLTPVLFTRCEHDPLLNRDAPKSKVLIQTYLEGSAIADVGISEYAVLASKRDVRELVEIRLKEDSMIFHNKVYNPIGSIIHNDIQGLQGVDESLILVGFHRGIIMSYKNGRFGNYLPMTHLEVFDQSCKLSVSDGNTISFLSERGKYVKTSPNALRNQGLRYSCIAACSDTVWLGTHGNGVYKITENQRVEQLAASRGSQIIRDDSIVAIRFDTWRNPVVVSRHGVAYKTNSTKWVSHINPKGIIGQSIAPHPNGDWYLGTNQGLFILSSEGMKPCALINKHLPGNNVLALEIDTNGVFWVATTTGLVRAELTENSNCL